MIYWMTGQPGSGKTTLGKKLEKFIKEKGKLVIHLDGDDLRAVSQNKDYSKEGRKRNVQTAQSMAELLHNKGFDVVVSIVSPYRSVRNPFKEKMGSELMEIFIHTTEQRSRDHFKVKDYERPIENHISTNTTDEDVNITFAKMIQSIRKFNKYI